MSEETQLRDDLAMIRTALANERTLLSWVRTALGLAAAGAALVELVDRTGSIALGWSLIAAGFATLAIGIVRFRMVRRQLAAKRARPSP